MICHFQGKKCHYFVGFSYIYPNCGCEGGFSSLRPTTQNNKITSLKSTSHLIKGLKPSSETLYFAHISLVDGVQSIREYHSDLLRKQSSG